MSKSQREQLTTYFREAKWRCNSIITDFANATRDAKSAWVKVGGLKFKSYCNNIPLR